MRLNTIVLALALGAGLLNSGTAYSYDGDVDYSAPYVTLDPETGKLITVDPKQNPPATVETQQQHDAGTADTPAVTETGSAATGGTDTSVTALPDPDGTRSLQAAGVSKGTVAIIAVSVILLIALVIAMTRRKSSRTVG